MDLSARVAAFTRLGSFLSAPENTDTLAAWAQAAYAANNWFVPENVQDRLRHFASDYLTEPALTAWLRPYGPLSPAHPRLVGLVLAGNLPAVGFHDVLAVLLSGHTAVIRPSSLDVPLMQRLLGKLVELTPELAPRVQFTDRLNAVQALIATGSDQSARQFAYYFSEKPHLIRRNRSSVAVLQGTETAGQLLGLAHDILDFYGLGCRSVAKLFVPPGYDFRAFYEAAEPLSGITGNHKYLNNYDYNKSIYLINGYDFLDNGFLMLKPDPALVSPISVCFYETVTDEADLQARLDAHADKIQCIVGQGHVPFGQSQHPALTDYADGIDTMAWLGQL